jgi:hypothetical protein
MRLASIINNSEDSEAALTFAIIPALFRYSHGALGRGSAHTIQAHTEKAVCHGTPYS